MRAPKSVPQPRIKGLILYELDKFEDHRGINAEIYKFYGNHTPFDSTYGLDSYSVSHKNVLRGAHYDNSNNKLIQCLFGEIQVGIYDAREGSPTYKNSLSFYLNYKRPMQLFIPVGVANAHLCLSDYCVFYYKWSRGYTPQKTIKWDEMGINWETEGPILSDKDR